MVGRQREKVPTATDPNSPNSSLGKLLVMHLQSAIEAKKLKVLYWAYR